MTARDGWSNPPWPTLFLKLKCRIFCFGTLVYVCYGVFFVCKSVTTFNERVCCCRYETVSNRSAILMLVALHSAVKAVTFIYVAAPPLLASTAAVMSNFTSVERKLIFHDFLHTLFYKHLLASRTLYVIWGRRYKGRCMVVASSQHLYVPFGHMLQRTWFVAETDHGAESSWEANPS